MKNAKRLLRKLDYLPRWAWYAMSQAIGGPVGPVVVYVAFHALQKAADDEDAEYDEWGAGSERREHALAVRDDLVARRRALDQPRRDLALEHVELVARDPRVEAGGPRRQLLHGARLEFPDPAATGRIDVVSARPGDFVVGRRPGLRAPGEADPPPRDRAPEDRAAPGSD